MTAPRLTYRFGPVARPWSLGPVRAGQALAVTAGAAFAIIALDRAPSGPGVLVALLGFSCAVVFAVAPLGGRTVEQWIPVAAWFALRRLSGPSRGRSPVPTSGIRSRLAGGARGRSIEIDAPLPVPPPALEN